MTIHVFARSVQVKSGCDPANQVPHVGPTRRLLQLLMFASVRVDEWEYLRLLGSRMYGWLFRGQPDSSWGLATSFERFATTGLWPAEIWDNRELWILRQFQRRAHLVVPSPPRDESKLEWLSIIQHYGGPTRLLDFTHSIYVASFFAVEPCLDCDASVWAINGSYLTEKNVAGARELTGDEINRAQVAIAEDMIGQSIDTAGVLQVEPDRLNERMSIQKGVFLFPTSIQKSFLANLATALEVGIDVLSRPDSVETRFDQVANNILIDPNAYRAVKFTLSRKAHEHVYFDLAAMNIDSATLFPGLEGFARSLRRHLRVPAFVRYPELIERRTEEP